MNMTELAVEKSPRSIETETAVASSTATESLPCSSAFSPSWIYFSERTIAIAVVTGTGRNSFDAVRRSTAIASLSSNSRFSVTGSVLRDKLHRLRCGKRKRRQRIYHCGALCAVAYDRVAGAVVHLHLVNAVHTAHVIFQHISLVQRHPRAFEMHTQPPARLMDYFAFHNSLPLAGGCRKAQVPPAAAAV